MPQTRLTGSRIRERRIAQGIRQADLARSVEISPAYLNLIEHNRRRIGGKLLVDLARALSVEPAQLSEGAEAAFVAALREAAAQAPGDLAAAPAETDRTEEFAGRFPGWSRLVTAQARRIEALERLVETLSDRLTHDPHLAASLHEVLSAVTAVRSVAAILDDTTDIDPDWQARFLRNLREDARRLSRSAEGLVGYLEADADADDRRLTPSDALAAFTEETGYHFAGLEAPGAGAAEVEAVLAGQAALGDPGAQDMARAMLARYLGDARLMPAAAFDAAYAAEPDPARLAARFGAGLDTALRRIASRPGPDGQAAGLVICDGSGTLTLRKPLAGFDLPRFGAGCPLWPLYAALGRPGQPVAARVQMPGSVPRHFRCFAVALAKPGGGFDAPAVIEATMIVLPEDEAAGPPADARPIGTTCRVCPRELCPARREPSILTEAA